MENSNSMNTIKVIGALMLGTALGGAIGVLFAPDKGSRTRRKLLLSGEEAAENMNDKFNDLLDDFKKQVGTMVKGSTDHIDHTFSKAEKQKVN